MKPLFVVALYCSSIWSLCAQESNDLTATALPKKIPTSRPEMKRALELLKSRQPRLPLPPAAEGESSVNNGRARALYLPESWRGGQGGNQPRLSSDVASRSERGGTGRRGDPAMTLDSTFKVRLFWIVSRVNNCHYCLGHQELKLARAGMAEDQIAELDCNWSAFPESEQVAFAFTRKLTLEPHLIGSQDLSTLQKHFTDNQIIELVQTVAGYNSTNRWTDALGLPQDKEFGGTVALLETATSEPFQSCSSEVIALTEPLRPALESQADVAKKLIDCGKRAAYVQLPEADAEDATLRNLGESLGVPNFARALAVFPTTAKRQLETIQGVMNDGQLPPRIKAEILWATSRENRAWYAVGHA